MNGDNTAAWAWLVYGAYILLGWIPIDLWLHARRHPYLTTQMRAWWHSPRTGPFIIGGLAFVVVAFIDHILSAGPHSLSLSRFRPAPPLPRGGSVAAQARRCDAWVSWGSTGPMRLSTGARSLAVPRRG